MRLGLRLAVISAGTVFLTFYLFQTGLLRFNYPNKKRYPIRGIDVSHHQGPIDWEAVAHEGVSFVYIKASEGGDFRDSGFQGNWKSALQAAIPAGAYHFFTFCRSGSDQARNFRGALAGVQGPMLAPAIDLEFGGNCRKRPSPEELAGEIRDFVDEVKRAYGLDPIFYVTTDFMTAYADALPGRSDIWIRSVYFFPSHTFRKDWIFWQFASRGRIHGISGPVDLSVFSGSQSQWNDFVQSRKSSSSPMR